MKRAVSIFAFSLLLLLLSACRSAPPAAGSGAASGESGESGEGVLPDWGVTLRVTSASASGLSYVWEQSGAPPEGELSTGTWYEVRRLEGGEWVPQPYQLEDVGWDTVAILLPEDGSLDGEADWEWLYGALPAGEYRFVKEVMFQSGTGDYDTEQISAPFTVEAVS